MIRAGRIWLYIPFEQRAKGKMIASYHFDFQKSKMWNWPLSMKARVFQIFPEYKQKIEQEIRQYNEAIKNIREVKRQNLLQTQIEPEKFKRHPMSHQATMTKFMIATHKYGLFCEMGTGKTQAGINTFQVLYEDHKITKCLVVCPKTVMDNWIEEIKINSNYKAALINGSKTKRLNKLKLNVQFYVINYDGLLVLKDYDHWNKFEMIILDESSKIKNHKAKRTEFLLETFKEIPYKYIMSGTPITQSPIDIWTQFNFLDPGIFAHKSYYEFRDDYCIMGGYNNKEIIGYKHQENLQLLINGSSIQIRKEQCTDLPEQIYTRRHIDMPKKIEQNCNDIMEGIGNFTGELMITKLLRVHQTLSGAYLKTQKDNKKLIELAEIIHENLFNGNQIIIWCKYRKSIELIEQMIQSAKTSIPYSLLHGDITNRKEQIDLFQQGTNKIFIGQVTAGGIGINLTAGNIVVYYENTFNLEDRLQSEARAHRIGQKKPVIYIDLLYKGSLDEKIFEAIRNKADIAEYLVKSFKRGEYK